MNFQGIRQARKAAGMTQDDLAKALGINRATLSKYESGSIDLTVTQLIKIANTLGVSMYDLLNTKEMDFFDAGVTEGQNALEWAYRNLDGYSFNKAELFLIRAFSKLNDKGQQEAVKRVEELTEIPKYQKAKEPPQPE